MEHQTSGQDDLYKLPDVKLFTYRQWAVIGTHYHLRPSELRVAKLVCKGLTDEEIAEKLNINIGTVGVHLRRIFKKTNANNRISMLLRFMEAVDFLNKSENIGRT